ncbi:M3 family metallopeptidase [Algoriphagus aestuariicola]|jgi:peptidyl-dipeptidase Dcp|uniref:M3 family metallopeptidase n=1 Tax=Algoriphagus aestuariicola TaxID=1852016 RepID=A0ABS3BUF2_9BACT|nr:M3 family metallopeptidase [Algoriphagus aestuariicola]MBN7801329.1 M3 family metallopeptidase [Algoriphagus aestuariicola]
MTNPLLADYATPFETAPFHLIHTEHFLPAITEAIQLAKAEIEIIKSEPLPTFENTVEALDRSGKKLGVISSIFFNLNSAETNDEIQKLAREISPLLTAHANDVLLDQELFQRVAQVFGEKDKQSLSAEQTTLLEKTYKSFVRNGAKLNPEGAVKLREIDRQLAQLSLKFGENVLAETNKYVYFVDNEKDLEGLPDGIKEAAAQIAEEKGQPGKWAFTLDYPSYVPAMTYAKSRELRKTLFMAYNTKAAKGDELDNKETIKELLKLRHERSNLLGYASHAHFVLEERMAKNPKAVMDFLDSFLQKAKPKAEADVREVAEFAKKTDGLENLERWDFGYYSELLKKERYALDDELLRPFFQLEKVVDGVFQTAEKLFGITFVPNSEIPVYHPEVTAYEVKDREGKHLAVFYADFFPRPGKRNGAWMTSFRGQCIENGQDHRPHVSIVCNFTKPTKSKPSLLTFNEVTTLFHEFGHALHGMMARGTYESLSGTSVYWDFVELPSQIFENWCYEKECLDIFAKHYQTGEKISAELIEKIKNAANFQQGYMTLRQISFGLLDMAYHSTEPEKISDIAAFEQEVMKKTDLLPKVPGTLMSTSFSHIFQGGYSSGYYSYKWAEVLDADAFELFSERGIFDQETAKSFEKNVLAAGGSEHPSILYKRFRGREPKPDALLRRSGLI